MKMKVLAALLAIAAIFNTADAQLPGYGLPPYGGGAVGYQPPGVGYPPAGYLPAGVGYPPVGYPVYPPPYNPTLGLNNAEATNANANTNVNSNAGGGAGRWF